MGICKKSSFILLFLGIYVSGLKASFTPTQISEILDRANHEFARKAFSSVKQYDYLISGDSMFLNPIGTHYLYSYKADRNTFLRLDKSQFHGANFERFLFLYNGEVYAFGGYGFWNANSRLIKFDRNSREWELIMIDGPEIPGKPLFTALHGDSILVNGFVVRHKKTNQENFLDRSYILNLKSLRIQEYRNPKYIDFLSQFGTLINSQNSNYVVMANMSSIAYIYSNSTQKLYRNLSGPSLYNAPEKSNDSLYHIVDGNELYSVKAGKIKSKINLQNYLNLYCNEVIDFNKLTPFYESNLMSENKLFLGILIATVLILIWLKKYVTPKKENLIYSQIDKSDEINFERICKFKGEIYSTQEMDVILKISHLPSVIRKIKRAELINSINEKTKHSIERLINEKSKGEFLYKIN